MNESVAEGLSVLGLVVGFPLLLLALMISLERLETWGLRPPPDQPSDRDADLVEAAVESVEQRTVPVVPPGPRDDALTSADAAPGQAPTTDGVAAAQTRSGGSGAP